MDVVVNGKSGAAYGAGQNDNREAVGEGRCGHRGAKEGSEYTQGGTGTQSDGHGDQQHLNHPDDAGVGITENNVPHGVGKQQTGNQRHQGADNGGIRIGTESEMVQDIGGHCHEKRGKDGGEKLVDLDLMKEPIHSAAYNAADTGAQTVGERASIEPAEARGTQHITCVKPEGRVEDPVTVRIPEPFHGCPGSRLFIADPAAEAGITLHSVQVTDNIIDAPHPCQRHIVIGHDRYSQTVGDGVGFRWDAVGRKNPVDAFFYPVGFRAAAGQSVSQFCGQIQEKLIIHGWSSFVVKCKLYYIIFGMKLQGKAG